MRDLFKNKLFIFLVIALVILGGLAAFTAGNRAAVTWVEDAINTVAQPIQRFSVRASNSIIDFFERVFKTSDADRENEQLKVRIAQYEIMENELNNLRQENQRLKELLDYADTVEEYERVTAPVIEPEPGDLVQSIYRGRRPQPGGGGGYGRDQRRGLGGPGDQRKRQHLQGDRHYRLHVGRERDRGTNPGLRLCSGPAGSRRRRRRHHGTVFPAHGERLGPRRRIGDQRRRRGISRGAFPWALCWRYPDPARMRRTGTLW